MILRDPVHGLVAFESEEADVVVRLLETREVQRLRRIRQLGLTSLAFPGAEHTRFSHALGAAHVMQLLVARLRHIDVDLPFWQRVTSDRAREAIAAAMLHDLGHGPFSHLFEQALPRAQRHEKWTTRILLDPSSEVHGVLAAEAPGLPRRVADLVEGRHELPYLANAVSGLFDVDRCDYLLRDARATGVTYGDYDLPWLLRSLRFDVTSDDPDHAPGLAVDGMKGITAIESFLLARLFMFQQVYFHKSTRAAETMIRLIIRRAVDLVAAGAKLPVHIAAVDAAAGGGEPTLDQYLELDDQALLVAIHAWEEAKDPVLADLSRRLRARSLFKTIELGDVETDIPAERAHAIARELATTRGLDPDAYVALDHATDTPFPGNSALKVIFPDGRSRDLADVSFLLGRLKGQPLVRTRLIFAAELRDDLRRALAS
ncbi:MAG: HD domain-containing protein [Polyangiaceae bacterium]|nr:HD domain-containing protein [Polyangiaceae bacterium]